MLFGKACANDDPDFTKEFTNADDPGFNIPADSS
jgi:hypothetical protein